MLRSRSSSKAQDAGHGARDLRHLDGVRQPVAEMIGQAGGEDLRLVLQAPKRPGMHNAVAIALECVAVRVRQLRIAAPPALLDGETEVRKRGR